jgi:hypothetical protein
VKFVPYQLLDGRPSVVMDGSPAPGAVLTVTHWPGYPPPAGIQDDLSAQMAFRLLERPDLVLGEAEAVSNNHFDQDGLVSIYALVAPDDAVQRRTFLEDLASAGDFALCRDRDAARLSMVLSALAKGDDLPADYTERTGVLYEDLLGRLPELCDHVERHRDVWGDEDATLEASDAAFEDGRAVIEERPEVDLAVVTVAEDAPEAGGHRFGGDCDRCSARPVTQARSATCWSTPAASAAGAGHPAAGRPRQASERCSGSPGRRRTAGVPPSTASLPRPPLAIPTLWPRPHRSDGGWASASAT